MLKTLKRKIALVAVAGLGAGLVSVAPASAATVAANTYGCTYTRNTLGPDESGTTRALRPATVANSAACPAT